ncbi:hypothetical protein TNCV_3131751 [Trichonephila clavipes]|nr:hypothetical protein TNCV_3131751 [Trichonephila clavipes]
MFYCLFGNFTELNRTVTCMMLEAKANDSVHLARCHDAFRGPRSDYVRQGTMHVKSVESSNVQPLVWYGRRGDYQVKCRPCHLTLVQDYEVRRQKPSSN